LEPEKQFFTPEGQTMLSLQRFLFTVVLLAGVLGFSAESRAQQPEQLPSVKVKAGYLTCHVDSGWGFIFGSSRELRCTYSPQPDESEFYSGSISEFGVDIGYLRSAVMLWSVLASSTHPKADELAGHYGGATASAAIGVGAGAHVLVGGFNNSIALQPVAIEGQNGLNVAAGIEALDLKYTGMFKATPPTP
jgi:Protein of unknown function (DUF992)